MGGRQPLLSIKATEKRFILQFLLACSLPLSAWLSPLSCYIVSTMACKRLRVRLQYCKIEVEDGDLELEQVRAVLAEIGMSKSFCDSVRPMDGVAQKYEAVNTRTSESKSFPTSIFLERIFFEADNVNWIRPCVEYVLVFDGEIATTTKMVSRFAYDVGEKKIEQKIECKNFPFARYFECDAEDASCTVFAEDVDGKTHSLSATKMKATKTPDDYEEKEGHFWQTD